MDFKNCDNVTELIKKGAADPIYFVHVLAYNDNNQTFPELEQRSYYRSLESAWDDIQSRQADAMVKSYEDLSKKMEEALSVGSKEITTVSLIDDAVHPLTGEKPITLSLSIGLDYLS